MRIETLAVHAGRRVDPTTGAVTPALEPADHLIEDFREAPR